LQCTLHATGRSDTEESLLKTLEKEQQEDDVVENKDDVVEKHETQNKITEHYQTRLLNTQKNSLYVAL
jgi:hypothetical protein